MVDAAKELQQKRLCCYSLFWMGTARQKRSTKSCNWGKISSQSLNAAGVDRVMTMDLHADQIQGFFEVPVDHLFASTFFALIKNNITTNLIMAAPDAGGSKRANAYAKHLDVDLALCYKQRKKANEISR